ncbi:MAG: hypothetical protein ACKODD_04620 [Candidatus Nanopelagicus sp.]|jgi:hypothetical protein
MRLASQELTAQWTTCETKAMKKSSSISQNLITSVVVVIIERAR